MPEPIGQIVRVILASPACVILPDTSSLLNLIEAPIPDEKVSPNVVPAALELVSRLQRTPPAVHLVLSHAVEREWMRHHISKQEKTIVSIRRADERISLLWNIASMMSSAPAEPCLQFSGLHIGQRLHRIAEQIVNSSKVIETEGRFQSAAGIRIYSGNAPATPGKKVTEADDCLLIEQYLELCRELRSAGFAHRCVFVTSNTKDFGEPKAPRPPLDREFSQAGIDFTYDFASAVSLLDS